MSRFFVFQAEDGIRYGHVTGVQTCALPISEAQASASEQASSESARPEDEQSSSEPSGNGPSEGEGPGAEPERRSEERRVGKGGREQVAAAGVKKRIIRKGRR